MPLLIIYFIINLDMSYLWNGSAHPKLHPDLRAFLIEGTETTEGGSMFSLKEHSLKPFLLCVLNYYHMSSTDFKTQTKTSSSNPENSGRPRQPTYSFNNRPRNFVFRLWFGVIPFQQQSGQLSESTMKRNRKHCPLYLHWHAEKWGEDYRGVHHL